MIKSQIIFLLGASQAGKDTAGEALIKDSGFTRVSFADAVKQKYADIKGIEIELLQKQGPEKEKHRAGLIELAEAQRKQDVNCWLNLAFEPYKINNQFKEGLKLVITDCRRASEIVWLIKQLELKALIELESESEYYLDINLWYIHNKEALEKDTDVLTHYAIGLAQGLNIGSNYSFINLTIENDSTISALHAKVIEAIKFQKNPVFI